MELLDGSHGRGAPRRGSGRGALLRELTRPALLAAWLLPCAPAAGAAAGCPRAVLLSGDKVLADSVGKALERRGIPTRAAPGCRPLQAQVARRAGEIQLLITDGTGAPPSERRVSDPGIAATLIESFVREDIDAPLLAARATPEPPGPPAPPAPPAPPEAPSAPPALPAVRLQLHAESSLGSDIAAWLGVAARACVRLGPTCAGLVARVAVRTPRDTYAGGAFQLVDVDLLAAVSVPLRFRGVLFAPGLGLGGRLLHVASEQAGANMGGLRVEAAAVLTVPLRRGIGLDVGLSAAAAFPPAGDLAVVQRTDREREEQAVALPPGPWGQLRAGLGLSWGTW